MRRQVISRIQKELETVASVKTKDWWEKYLKHETPFRGVKMADIRAVVNKEFSKQSETPEWKKALAYDLIREEHSEDKLAGILILSEHIIDDLSLEKDLDALALVFDEGYIRDWNICDWFCVKVMSKLAKNQGTSHWHRICAWKDAENQWRKRASCVSFVNLAQELKPGSEETRMIFDMCHQVIQSPWRFHQTAVGWLLREISKKKSMETHVVELIKSNHDYFGDEALSYATRAMSASLKKVLLRSPRNKKKRPRT